MLLLVEDFINSHRTLIDEEEAATKAHIRFLGDTTTALNDLKETFPKEIENILFSFNSINQQLSQFVNERFPDFHDELKKEMTLGLEKLNNDFVRKINTAYTKMSKTVEQIDPKVDMLMASYTKAFDKFPDFQQAFFKKNADEFENIHSNLLSTLNRNIEPLKKFSGEISSHMADISEEFSECKNVVNSDFKEALSHLQGNIHDLNITITEANKSIYSTSDVLDKNLIIFDQNALKRIIVFQEELAQIDQLIDSFVKVTKKRFLAN